MTAEHSYTGRRRTTTYTITAEGRQAVREWLSTPPQRALLEFEVLLRVMFAPLGTPEHLLAALGAARADADEMLAVATGIQDEYLRAAAPFQDHAYVRAHMHDFLVRYGKMRREWADEAIAEIRAWDGMTPEERTEQAIRIFERGPAPRDAHEDTSVGEASASSG